MQKPRIVQAADAIAYLPLYVAEQSCFALISDNSNELSWDDAFDPPFRSPPPEYLEGVVGETRRTGDQGCLNAIRNAWAIGHPLIGICDPCNIVEFDDLVIVGGLISRASFWCLIDDRLPQAKKPEELQVSHLFIHERGFLTGFRIGERILEALPRHISGPPDTVLGTFELLVDGAVWKKQNDPLNVVAAISASILSCVLAKHRGFQIAFALHEFPDYSEFLNTAIVVHREALKHQHVRRALILLLRGISLCQGYPDLMNSTAKEILRLCNTEGRFSNERKIDHAIVNGYAVIPRDPHITNAPCQITLEQAEDVWQALRSIYSHDCEVSEASWRNAMKLRTPNNKNIPELSSYFDNSLVSGAKHARLNKEGPGYLEHTYRRKKLSKISDSWYLFLSVVLSITVSLILAHHFRYAFTYPILVVLIILIIWLRFPFNAKSVPNLLDKFIIAAWLALIFSIPSTFLTALTVNLAKSGETFYDLTEYVGPELNTKWQWYAGRISNAWEPLVGFLAGVATITTPWVLSSRAQQLLPKWLRRIMRES